MGDQKQPTNRQATGRSPDEKSMPGRSQGSSTTRKSGSKPGSRPGVLSASKSNVERRLRKAPATVASSALVGLTLLSLFSCVGPSSKSQDSAQTRPVRRITSEPWIRVLIVENKPTAFLEISGLCAVHTADPVTGDATVHAPVATLDGLPKTSVVAQGTGLVIEGQAHYSGAILLRPQESGKIKINDVAFHGDVVLKSSDRGLRVINELPLEMYLKGVLGKEMPLGFPDEALHAQAMAARTYALWQIRKRKKSDHDVKTDHRSQVYGGADAIHPKAVKIIDETRGMAVTYQGDIFETFFHSTCGGVTIDAKHVFGGKSFRPLSGADCGQCQSSKYYRWRKTVTKKEFLDKLRAKGVNIVEPVTSIRAVGLDIGRYQESVIVEHSGGVTKLPAAKVRFYLGLRSTAFDLQVSGEKLDFDGSGWGHGVGLCQIGAKGYAKQGFTGAQIVTHYYPGTVIETLY